MKLETNTQTKNTRKTDVITYFSKYRWHNLMIICIALKTRLPYWPCK